jgi:predicted PurR-regulated permease PerM
MITSKTIANGILKAIGILIAIALLLLFLYQINSVLIYIVVAFILTLIGNPIVAFLKKRLKFNNTLATAVTVFIFILIITGFILMFIPLILSQGENLSLLNTSAIEKNIIELTNQITIFFKNHHIDSLKILKDTNLTSKINFNTIPDFLNLLLSTITSFGIGLASVLFITFFFLKDRLMFVAGLKKLIPDNQEDKILHSLDKINLLLTRYFIGLIIQLSIVFFLYLTVLLIFGIPNAFVIAFLCAVLNIIPYIGPLIATILAAILTMISHLGSDFQTEILPITIYVLIGFWVVQLIDNNISQPFIFSKSVSSHPLEIFLVILIAGFLFGILGMIIAIPLFTIIKVIGKEFFPENKIVQLLTKKI